MRFVISSIFSMYTSMIRFAKWMWPYVMEFSITFHPRKELPRLTMWTVASNRAGFSRYGKILRGISGHAMYEPYSF